MNKITAAIAGLAKSKTIAFAIALAVLGAVQMYVDVLRPLFHSQAAFGYFCMILAAAVAILRVVTTQSLLAKGGNAATGNAPPESG